MWPYHPELLARPVPRYTSFPTAAEFGNGVGGDDLDAALRQTVGDVSLYVHIPYCEQICWYCGCNTGAANKRHRLAAYLDALTHEIALVGARLDGRVRVRRIAFGGGSPNAISPTDFVRLVDALTLRFNLSNPEFSIELDPRNLTNEWGDVIRLVGITRASLGVQTFEPALQQAIGRVQPGELIERCTSLLRGAGVTSLNYDLMYGLPGQTWDSLETSLARASILGADRIALFGYAHVPHMLPRQKRIDGSALPGQDERFMMAARGYDYLTGEGYTPVGFDHFARPGDSLAQATVSGRLRRNFQGFTEDQAPVLIGLGASSISCFPNLLIQNEKNAGRYREMLAHDRLPGVGGVARGAQDQELGAIINGLLCQGQAQIGGPRAMELRDALEPFLSRGLADLDAGVLTILPGGLPYARTIAALFDPYRQDSARRFSSAV
jgi:oxygen-independent coproporphyrinogen-3 oxidase